MDNFNLRLSDTLNRIEESLNVRFEKDTSLYIKKSDEERVKKAIVDGHYQNLSALAKKLGDKIVAVVIMKNSWLVSLSSLKKCKRSMVEIFESLNRSFMGDISKDILNDNVYSSIEFKDFIESFYYKSLPADECERIYKSENEKISIRSHCYARYIEDYCKRAEDGKDVAEKIDYELNDYRDIKNYLNKNSWVLSRALSQLTDSMGLCTWILRNILCNPIEKMWESILLSFKNDSLRSGCQYINENPYYANENTKYVVQKLFPYLSECVSFEENVVELYDNNREVRIFFIHMLSPQRFRDKDLANKILIEFEKIGVNPNWSDHRAKIREWTKIANCLRSAEEFVRHIDDNNPDLTNIKTLGFYTNQISKNNSLVIELFNEYGGRTEVENILSNYFANVLSKDNSYQVNQLDLSQKYIDKIVCFIEKNHINSQHTRDFLGKHKKFDILEKLNRR